jgi:hypothetical protein
MEPTNQQGDMVNTNIHLLKGQFHDMDIVLKTYTVNEGPVRIQYKCLVPVYVFPEMKLFFPKQNYNVLSPPTLIYL